jgi:hypothetical protein
MQYFTIYVIGEGQVLPTMVWGYQFNHLVWLKSRCIFTWSSHRYKYKGKGSNNVSRRSDEGFNGLGRPIF